MSARRLSSETGAVTYQEKLGSYGEKVERMRELARWLAEQWFASGIAHASVGAADRAAELSKCDLVTEMVREFTELQGIVGGLYAKSQGEPEEVAWAVYDQYKPAGLEDSIPQKHCRASRGSRRQIRFPGRMFCGWTCPIRFK